MNDLEAKKLTLQNYSTDPFPLVLSNKYSDHILTEQRYENKLIILGTFIISLSKNNKSLPEFQFGDVLLSAVVEEVLLYCLIVLTDTQMCKHH